jgi:hypothetical protein
MAAMKLALREHLSGEIQRLERRLAALVPRSAAARASVRARSEIEAWLAFLLLLVIVAGAGVWLGVASRAILPPQGDCIAS